MNTASIAHSEHPQSESHINQLNDDSASAFTPSIFNPYPDILDVSALLLPISGDLPTGTDPREDISPHSTYYRFKEARNAARAAERAFAMDDETADDGRSHWQLLVREIPQALQKETKDLELTAWLVEGLCRLYGLKGLIAGFSLTKALLETYWNQLYPTPDEDGLETRIGPLIGLNGIDGEGTLITPIVSIALTEDKGEGEFAAWQVERAIETDRLDEEKKRRRLESGVESVEQIKQAAQQSSPAYLAEVQDDIQLAMDIHQQLSGLMDEVMGGQPQPTSMITKALRRVNDALQFMAGDIIANYRESLMIQEADNQEGEENHIQPGQIQTTSGVAGADVVAAQLANRESAIRELKRVAEYFRKTEPHSPVSYAIEQAVRWSDLSLPELLNELIDDGQSRASFFKLTGIPVED